MGGIVSFKEVRISIPSKHLKKIYLSSHTLTRREHTKNARLLEKIDKAILKLRHVQSVVEKIQLRNTTY